MDPGEFDTLVKIVRPTKTGRDAAGTPQFSDVTVSEPWAKVAYPGGKEFLQGQGEASEQRVVFRIYRDDRVDTGTVVIMNGNRHDVQDMRPFSDVMELHTVARPPKAPTP